MSYITGFLTPVKAEDKHRYIPSARQPWPLFQKYRHLDPFHTRRAQLPPGQLTGLAPQ